ncbi:transposase [Methylococcaceae bacterium CS3]|nr:transposase [Methylococcaceae bacterium CS3]
MVKVKRPFSINKLISQTEIDDTRICPPFFFNSCSIALCAGLDSFLNLSITQIIEYYGARWKIESGFKELKQDIGSQKSQCRNAQAVTNHLNFCMMATTLTWIYADRLKTNPERRHKVKGRTSFAFSDIRRIIAEAALDPDFERVCPKYSSSPVNSVVTVLLRMVA